MLYHDPVIIKRTLHYVEANPRISTADMKENLVETNNRILENYVRQISGRCIRRFTSGRKYQNEWVVI